MRLEHSGEFWRSLCNVLTGKVAAAFPGILQNVGTGKLKRIPHNQPPLRSFIYSLLPQESTLSGEKKKVGSSEQLSSTEI